ncbi:MAG: hypothetical protein ACYDGN_11460 [Acidimicrobiales bacterium]
MSKRSQQGYQDQGAPSHRRSVPIVNQGAAGGLAAVGLLTLLLGAWVGIIPYVGPLFGFGATSTKAWVWNNSHLWLWLLPGAVAVLMGFMMLSRAPLARRGMTKLGPLWAGFIVACCGAWLVIGPSAWKVLESRTVIRPASAFRELVYLIGYSFGPGLLLALFGGLAMGIAMVTRRAASPVAVPLGENAETSHIAA